MDPAPSVRELPIRFVGSGSEYFRIWIVNLLLTLVTLGLYYPVAKVRRLRYFYGSTEVAGRPLAFHGSARQMLRGFLLVGVLFAAYSVASNASALAGGVAVLVVGALWPGLWRSSLRFRLANTGWSGLRGAFTGSLIRAYLAFWPLLVALPLLAAGAGLMAFTRMAIAAALLGVLLLLPLALWSLRRYQHSHYAFGDEQTRFEVRPAQVYGVLLRTALLSLLTLLPLGAVAVWASMSSGSTDAARGQAFLQSLLPALAFISGWLLYQTVVQPYATARLQNLFWNGTRSQRLRPQSRLRARSLILLSLKNWLLVLLTLGLYLPFAAVATARLRLQAMVLLSKVDPQDLLAGSGAGREGAAGDAAGDLFGVDIGL